MFEVDFHILNQKSTPAIYADDLANRPAFGFAGRIFINTVTPYGVYRDTGSAWVQIASNGGGGGGSTGVNGLNGTANIGLGGTLENNTIIDADSFKFQMIDVDEFDIQTSGSSNTTILNNSLGINLQVNQISSGLTSTFFIEKDKITTGVGVTLYGLYCDFINQQFYLGDHTKEGGKKFCIKVDDSNDQIYFTTGEQEDPNKSDLLLAKNSGAIRFIRLGDSSLSNTRSGISLEVNDADDGVIETRYGGDRFGFVTGTNNIFHCGDYANTYNGTKFCVDCQTSKIYTTKDTSATVISQGLEIDLDTNNFSFGNFGISGTDDNYLLCTSTDLALNCGSDKLSINGNNIITSPEAIPISAMIVYVNGTRYKINLY